MSHGWRVTPTAPSCPSTHTLCFATVSSSCSFPLLFVFCWTRDVMLHILQLDTHLMDWLTWKCLSTWLPGNPDEKQVSHPLADEQIGSGAIFSRWNYCRRFFPSGISTLLFKLTELAYRLNNCYKKTNRGTCDMTAEALLVQWTGLKTNLHLSETTTSEAMAVECKE